MFDTRELVDACRTATVVDVHACVDDDLLAGVGALEAARRAIDAATVAFTAELDARKVCDQRSGHRTKDWLTAEHGVEPGDAARRVRVGAKLRHLPLVATALAAGTITVDHARVLADAANPRVLDVVAAAQAELIALAATMTFTTWARHVRALVDLADADGGHDPRPERRRVTLGRTPDGHLHLTGTLVGAAGVTLEHALETHTDRLYRRAVRDHRAAPSDCPTPTRAQLRADALTELIDAGHTALTSGTATRPTADVTVTIPHDHPTLTRTSTGDGCDTGTGRGPAVAAGTGELRGTELATALCDALLTGVVVDPHGTPLAVGRAHRHPTPDQRRALQVRDGGCAFPGCTAPPRWCDAHHVTPWHPTGPTDPDNLLLLCRHHHGVIHRTGWSVHHTGGQHFAITTPTGRTLTAQRHGQPPPGAPPPGAPPPGPPASGAGEHRLPSVS